MSMDVCERISELDDFITRECINGMYLNEYEGVRVLRYLYYAGLSVAAAIQEQTAVINEMKDMISCVVEQKKDAWGNMYGAVTVTGGLNTYEQN